MNISRNRTKPGEAVMRLVGKGKDCKRRDNKSGESCKPMGTALG